MLVNVPSFGADTSAALLTTLDPDKARVLADNMRRIQQEHDAQFRQKLIFAIVGVGVIGWLVFK